MGKFRVPLIKGSLKGSTRILLRVEEFGGASGVEALGKLWVEGLVPRGSIYTTIMELGPKRPSPLWFLGPNSIIVVYMDPLG